jgi:aryl-alcohol dehydrogenase-like predicted oxidoreductase
MELRQLGRSSLHVSPIILGTWAIGGWMWGGSDEKQAIEAIQASIEQGINTLDTAPIYGMGHSEEIVGKAIKGKRQHVIIATKCGMRWDSPEGSDPWPNQNNRGEPVVIRKNLKPASIIYECEQSLKRLKTDVIDLYQIHWPDASTPIEESWNAMVELKKQGKVRAIGVSNYNLDQLKQAHALHPVDSIQPPYSLIRREIEKDLIPFCQKEHIGVIVYSPLERGLLTGKYTSHSTFPEGDHRARKPIFSPSFLSAIQQALAKIQPIAQRHHATLSQIIIHSTNHQPGITAALVGARNAVQAMENARAADLKLSTQELQSVVHALAQPALQVPLYD